MQARFVSLLVICTALFMAAFVSSASATVTTYLPTADAQVRSDNPNTNYGNDIRIPVEGKGTANGVACGVSPYQCRNSFLKFDVTVSSGSVVTDAKLRVYTPDAASGSTVDLYAQPDDSWIETSTGGITWNNQPIAPEHELTEATGFAANSWVEFNVTPAVIATDTYSFELKTLQSRFIGFDSEDNTRYNIAEPDEPINTYDPQLVVTTTTADGTPPTASITAPEEGAQLSGITPLTADATDDSGTVSKVEWYIDSSPDVLIATDTSSPWDTTWDTTTVGDGSYALIAKAYDPTGNVGTSSSVNVTVENSPDPGCTPRTITQPASADAYVREDQTTTNFGTSASLLVDAADPAPYHVESLVKFDISGIGTCVVTDTKLRLYVTNETGDGPSVQKTASSWIESGTGSVTWATKPALEGSVLDNETGLTPAPVWAEWNVTSGVTSDATYSFILKADSTNGVTFNSRTAGSNTPELVVTLANPPAPPQCNDNLDNDSDGKIDFDGNGGTPDPGCGSATDTSEVDTAAHVVAAVGDTVCSGTAVTAGLTCRQGQVSDLVMPNQLNPEVLLHLGDAQYTWGTQSNFTNYYGPTYGRPEIKNLTRITPGGSHDCYGFTATCSGNSVVFNSYFGAFGQPNGAGQPYSFNVGDWHIMAIPDYCDDTTARGFGIPTCADVVSWIGSDLDTTEAQEASCQAVMQHKPRFTSGTRHNNEDDSSSKSLWQKYVDEKVDVVFQGHEHVYERIAPKTNGSPSSTEGALDNTNGVPSFIIGTGGRNTADGDSASVQELGSEFFDRTAFGVLKLTLENGSLDYEFIDLASPDFTNQWATSDHDDSGTIACHS